MPASLPPAPPNPGLSLPSATTTTTSLPESSFPTATTNTTNHKEEDGAVATVGGSEKQNPAAGAVEDGSNHHKKSTLGSSSSSTKHKSKESSAPTSHYPPHSATTTTSTLSMKRRRLEKAVTSSTAATANNSFSTATSTTTGSSCHLTPAAAAGGGGSGSCASTSSSNTASSSSSSSSSGSGSETSSDEEEDDDNGNATAVIAAAAVAAVASSFAPNSPTAAATTTNAGSTTGSRSRSKKTNCGQTAHHKKKTLAMARHRKAGVERQPQQHQNQQQPEGWRVKLYRLNQDGTWADCGTGRILCIAENYSSSTSTTITTMDNEKDDDDAEKNGNMRNDNDATGNNDTKQPAHETSNNNSSSRKNQSDQNDNAEHDSSTIPQNQNEWHRQQTQQQYQSDATLCVQAEVAEGCPPRVLLRTKILLSDAYKPQGDNIITWCEPYDNLNNIKKNNSVTSRFGGNDGEEEQQQLLTIEADFAADDGASSGGVELALSFQDNCGCLEIWQQIKAVQGRQVEEVAAEAAAQHHATMQQQQQQQQGQGETNNEGECMINRHDNNSNNNNSGGCMAHGNFSVQWDPSSMLLTGSIGNELGDAQQLLLQQHLHHQQQFFLERLEMPSPPSLQNLDEIADTIAALQHVQQRESLAEYIASDDCLYLRQLLDLFPTAEAPEARGDFSKLATLAACVKTVLLLNSPSVLELIVTEAEIFEEVCACLEYDPDLRLKANHRWFLRERARFRTVVRIDDPDLIQAIHRTFRVQYLRDTLLRPTMDESSLSTLSSLQTFTHADVVKGVTMSGGTALKDCYLGRVIRLLGVELNALLIADWSELESSVLVSSAGQQRDQISDCGQCAKMSPSADGASEVKSLQPDPQRSDFLKKEDIVEKEDNSDCYTSAIWKQYVAPQDGSLSARRIRRRGCVSFLRELFQMVRLSLQQCDKDDFFSVFCTLEVQLTEEHERSDDSHATANLLSLLANVLLDVNADVKEKGDVLEIVAGVAMHDPSLLRRHCLECHRGGNFGSGALVMSGPESNDKRQVVFVGPSNDLLSAFIFLLDVETDAGALLQVSEIMRIILDTDISGDHGPISPGFTDEAELPPVGAQHPPHDQHNQPSGSGPTSTEQARFLSVFYDHYVEWLVAPFQFTILHPARRIPDNVLRSPTDSILAKHFLQTFRLGILPSDPWLRTVPACSVRKSFTVELLSFCVRAHLSRMKHFLLKTRVIGSVLDLLRSPTAGVSGDRCLKLAALRLFRAVLAVNDEAYHRHIIHHNLFAPVFEVFRRNPVGDNLVSSAIVEMCHYIQQENIRSLLECIVRKHLTAHGSGNKPSLEDVSNPYVTTFTTLRKAYENNVEESRQRLEQEEGSSLRGESRYFSGGFGHGSRRLSGLALEDQRKFREVDDEESYFDGDDEEEGGLESGMYPQGIDKDDALKKKDYELHRTPRMFSLTQRTKLNHLDVEKEDNVVDGKNGCN